MKTLKILLILFVVAVIVLVIAGWLLFRSPGISSQSVLLVHVGGEIQEYRPDSTLASLLGEEPVTQYDLTRILRHAAKDEKIEGVVLRIHPFSMGFAHMQELRAYLQDLSKAGKWTAAYLDTVGEFYPGNGQYYLASACETISVNPLGDVNLIGLHAEVPFFRGTLEKLKIEPDFDHIREYKTAMNTFTEKEFTEAHREMMESLLQDLYDQMVSGIAASRGMDPDVLRDVIENGPYSAAEALEIKLIDHTKYWAGMKEFVEEKAGESFHWVKTGRYLKTVKEKGEKIALIFGMGPIFVGESSTSPFASSPTMGSDSIARLFRKVRENDNYKAVIFRVNSPGGSAVASEVIRHEMVLTKEKKPVVVSMSNVAGSGGYWVSMSADRIIADPGTLTGSIGVVVGKFNTRKFWEELIGITHGEVKVGKNADMYSSLHNFSEEQREKRTQFMESIYREFVRLAAEGRGLTEERVNEIGRGRVWTGKQALDLKLVDGLGGLDSAVLEAKKLANIAEDKDVKLVCLPGKKSFLEVLTHREDDVRVWLERLKSGNMVYGPVWCPVRLEIQ